MAFEACENLTRVNIPNSVTGIGYGAFGWCEKLTEITVASGNSAYLAENGVLYNKNKTILHTYLIRKTERSFRIPSGIISIGDMAFADCNNLTRVNIPDSVTSIGEYAFYYCENLTSVTFEGTIVREIEYYDDGHENNGYEIKTNPFDRAFCNDLYEKFYEKDAEKGTPGTYTITAPIGENSIWTRQP